MDKPVSEFFYCYSPNLFAFLTMGKKIRYICCGINENTKKKFWQYHNTSELNSAFQEYRELKKGTNG